MKILLTGCNGFLGQHLTTYLANKDLNITALSRGSCKIEHSKKFIYCSLDLTNEETVKKNLQENNFDIIIHNAAMSKPDECEHDKVACLENNVHATEYLLKYSSDHTHFMYISTDFIFGENGPHDENETPAPLNFYGESKLMAEQLVKTMKQHYTIVRPVFIYGPSYGNMRPSFLHWVKKNLENGNKIKVVKDQLRTPTYVFDICHGIETILHQKQTGTFHLAGKDIVSPYEMALMVAAVLKLDISLIEAVTAETFTEPVQRAKRSGLKIDKAIRMLQYNPVSFEEGVYKTFF